MLLLDREQNGGVAYDDFVAWWRREADHAELAEDDLPQLPF